MIQIRGAHKLLLAIFSFSIFSSAALMFAIQPMVGKMLLPLVGGSPAGWIVAMAFFQIALLAGYAIAHLFSLFEARIHGVLFIALLAAGLYMLPFFLAHQWPQVADIQSQYFRTFALLGLTVSLPFVALSVGSPTIQRLFSITGHKESQDPYFLYAASNIGSFIGLFSYPLILEPLFGLTLQSHIWMWGYTGLIGAVVLCLLFALKPHKTAAKTSQTTETITWARRLKWLALAFVPSSLMLGVTTHITTDIASAPLLWTLPLALYLLTHIIAFARKRIISLKNTKMFHALGVCTIVGFTASGIDIKTWSFILVHLTIFWVSAQMCHFRLVDDRPHVKHLTEFYLFLALGGALGGSFNAFVAPVIFSLQLEYPLMLVASLLLNPESMTKPSKKLGELTFFAIGLGIIALIVLLQIEMVLPRIIAGLVVILALILSALHVRQAFIATAAILLLTLVLPGNSKTQHIERNFFGIIKVEDRKIKDLHTRFLMHGTTLHGIQVTKPKAVAEPTAYYIKQGPAGDVFRLTDPKNIGVIGLGAGAIACYHTPDRKFDFYEIDPAVYATAKEWFTFLNECGENTNIYIGDGRLELQNNQDARYDLLILDAFSSDAIPMHLLTIEAFEMYRSRLRPGGKLLVHTSNRFLNLEKPITRIAEALDMKSLQARYKAEKDTQGFSSTWMLLTPKDSDTSKLEKTDVWKIRKPDLGYKLWTDDFTNMLSVMILR